MPGQWLCGRLAVGYDWSTRPPSAGKAALGLLVPTIPSRWLSDHARVRTQEVPSQETVGGGLWGREDCPTLARTVSGRENFQQAVGCVCRAKRWPLSSIQRLQLLV